MKTEERSRLANLFDLVANPNDWRAPINCTLGFEVLGEANATTADVCEAVAFFTATECKAVKVKGGWHFTAKGYRAGPAGP